MVASRCSVEANCLAVVVKYRSYHSNVYSGRQRKIISIESRAYQANESRQTQGG